MTALAGFDHVVGQSLRRHENNNNRLDPTQPLNRRSELERPAFSDAPSAWPGYQQSKGRSQLGSRSGSRLSCLHSKDFVIVSLVNTTSLRDAQNTPLGDCEELLERAVILERCCRSLQSQWHGCIALDMTDEQSSYR